MAWCNVKFAFRLLAFSFNKVNFNQNVLIFYFSVFPDGIVRRYTVERVLGPRSLPALLGLRPPLLRGSFWLRQCLPSALRDRRRRLQGAIEADATDHRARLFCIPSSS